MRLLWCVKRGSVVLVLGANSRILRWPVLLDAREAFGEVNPVVSPFLSGGMLDAGPHGFPRRARRSTQKAPRREFALGLPAGCSDTPAEPSGGREARSFFASTGAEAARACWWHSTARPCVAEGRSLFSGETRQGVDRLSIGQRIGPLHTRPTRGDRSNILPRGPLCNRRRPSNRKLNP
jgi:hypothetical protein